VRTSAIRCTREWTRAGAHKNERGKVHTRTNEGKCMRGQTRVGAGEDERERHTRARARSNGKHKQGRRHEWVRTSAGEHKQARGRRRQARPGAVGCRQAQAGVHRHVPVGVNVSGCKTMWQRANTTRPGKQGGCGECGRARCVQQTQASATRPPQCVQADGCGQAGHTHGGCRRG
jgi:hypothetical protein